MLNRNDSVKKNFNHRWTQINTDEEMSERRSGPDFRRSLNDALYVVLEYHVFYPCPSVVKKSFTAWLRLKQAEAVRIHAQDSGEGQATGRQFGNDGENGVVDGTRTRNIQNHNLGLYH